LISQEGDTEGLNMSEKITNVNHKIVIEERSELFITGVKKVKSFDPKEIHLDTLKGNLIIKGQDLGVKNLNLDQTEIEIQGQIDLLSYPVNRSSDSSRGVWEKIFK